jgi:hypothetical protein
MGDLHDERQVRFDELIDLGLPAVRSPRARATPFALSSLVGDPVFPYFGEIPPQ